MLEYQYLCSIMVLFLKTVKSATRMRHLLATPARMYKVDQSGNILGT